MEREKTPPDDEYNIRCPRLGHQISFSYCRSENRGLPCFKTLDCWFSHFKVEEFLKEELSPEEWEQVFSAPPKPKLLSLVELIEHAKKRKKEIVAGLILAAGVSERMGKPKLQLPVGEGILLERVLSEVLKSDLDTIVLVLGHQAKEIRSKLGRVLAHPKLKVVENRQYRQGMSSSIIRGLKEIEDTHDHVMILLGDIPNVDAGLINQLLRRYLDSRLPIGAVKTGSKRTHPVIFSRRLYAELHGLKGDVGGKPLLEKYRDRICLVEPERPYDDRDIDTPEDYAEFLKELD